MSYLRNDMFDAIAFGMTTFDRSGHVVPIRFSLDWARPGSDMTVSRSIRRASHGRRVGRPPRLHPTKGYRGAHKLFRGGSR